MTWEKYIESRSMRARGLKHANGNYETQIMPVALHASAWIEKWKEIKSKNEKNQSLKSLRSLLHPYSMRVM